MNPTRSTPRCNPHRPRRALSSRRGSLLIVTMIFAAVIGISLASYIRLAGTALRTADRSFYANSAVDLAESGIEQAMACFYKVSTGTAVATAWSGWTLSGSSATRLFSGFTPGPNATGAVRVYVSQYDLTGSPKVVAKSTISLPSGAPIEKYVEITLGSRGPFSMGIVAKDSITISGNGSFDSWSSDPDNDPTTAPIPYSSGVATANCGVGVLGSTGTDLTMSGNASIYGSIHMGPSATETHSGNASVSNVVGGSGWNSALVHKDFSGSFPAVTVPTASFVNAITNNPGGGTSFPRAGDTAASDGKYYYNVAIGKALSLSGNNTVTIAGNCVFIFANHSGVTTISTSGNARIVVNNNASMVVYTNGNISLSGNGLVNNNLQPSKCLIYGTNPSSQSASFSGNGSGGAVYYMPNGSISLTGNGDFRGAIVANTISASGNGSFHYDLALANIGGGNGGRPTKWKELRTAAERQVYAAQLNF